MKATEAKLLDFLRRSTQFVIPVYQRTYSWTKRECQQLWDDIVRAGKDDSIAAYFVGSIVYIEQGIFHVIRHPPLSVIDGQQRLTTVMLILEALARQLGEEEPLEDFSAKKIRNYYLLNPFEDGERRFKLLLTQTDKESLLAIVQQTTDWQEEPSIRIAENFNFFEKQVQSLRSDFTHLCRGLAKLVVVDITLSRGQDKPQMIFESMNSTGRELTQADLIRNFLLMELDPDHQKRLYDRNWRPMEVAFGQKAYSLYFDNFMRHYLTLKTGEIPKANAVYETFQKHARPTVHKEGGTDFLVAEIHTYANYYCAMALDQEKRRVLADVFRDLRELKVDVAYPLLLKLYADCENGILSVDDFAKAVRVIESYVFRRAVCGIPPNSMNRVFATLGRSIKKGSYLESLQARFLLLPSYRRFPNDDEFMRSITLRDLYNFNRRHYWLRRLENHDRNERAEVNDYTIEHILPQNEDLSCHWQKALGPDWQRVQKTWVHTLGNLTLTGYNSKYSDRPFNEKRDMCGGFKESPLRLNRGLGLLDVWNESKIQERAKRLAAQAVLVWKMPTLSEDRLSAYRSEAKPPTKYKIDDYQQLTKGSPMRALFDAFQEEVLALNPCISEAVRKYYIAYRAETNFVEITPQNKRLRLVLNVRFHELDDPRKKAKDITSKGEIGDAEVSLDLASDLSYVIRLVRQAFERQMGGSEI